MSRPMVVLDLAGKHELARDLVAGGVFVPGCTVELNVECELVVKNRDGEVRAAALVVFANPAGAGLQLIGCDAELKQKISALANPPDPAEDEADDDVPKNVHERLRGLPLAQQLKLAHTGEVSERIVLERMYGKNVWEALLRNPRLSVPEVTRIAQMGSLPVPLLDLIVSNGAWLASPTVRRGLLGNPRLGADAATKVLRAMPQGELKLVPKQTAYPAQIREIARRLLRK